MTVTTRPARSEDAGQMCDLLNDIIARGGTTAHETSRDAGWVRQHYITGPSVICCFVAMDETDRIAGFQCVDRNPDLPVDCGDIGSFARQNDRVPGVGTALFAATTVAARAAGLHRIEARIRADNTGGLAYYRRMGFVDHDVIAGVPLADGTPVDRIVTRLVL